MKSFAVDFMGWIQRVPETGTKNFKFVKIYQSKTFCKEFNVIELSIKYTLIS